MSIVSKIRKEFPFLFHAFHTITSRGILLGLGFLSGIIIARLLGPKGKGILAMFLVIPSMVLSFSELGIRQSATYIIGQRKYDRKDIQSSIMFLYFISAIVTFLFIIIIYAKLKMLTENFVISILFALMGTILLLRKYAGGILLGNRQIEQINYIQLIQNLGLLILFIFTIGILNLGIEGAALSYFFMSLLTSLIIIHWISEYGTLTPKWIPPIPLEMVKKGIWYALSLLVVSMNFRIDVLMLGKLKSVESVGIYSTGVNITELLQNIPQAIGMVLFSYSSNWQINKYSENIIKVISISKTMVILNIFLGVVLVIISPHLIPLVWGEAFRNSSKVIPLLLPGIIALSPFMVLHLFMAGQGKPKLTLYAFVPALITNVILNLLLIPKWDYLGAALASSISYFIGTVIYIIIFKSIFHISKETIFLVKCKDLKNLFSIIRHILRR